MKLPPDSDSEEGLFRVAAEITNRTSLERADQLSRDEVLPYSFAATHTILAAREGEFISLMDPPDGLHAVAAQCRNVGTWPVLVGEQGERRTMLSSPIIYDSGSPRKVPATCSTQLRSTRSCHFGF